VVAVLSAWLVPGLGHFYLKRPLRGLAFFALVVASALIGCKLEGHLYQVMAGQPLTILATFASHRTTALVAAGAPPADALLAGYRYAFGVAMIGVLVALALAALVLRRRPAVAPALHAPTAQPVSGGR